MRVSLTVNLVLILALFFTASCGQNSSSGGGADLSLDGLYESDCVQGVMSMSASYTLEIKGNTSVFVQKNYKGDSGCKSLKFAVIETRTDLYGEEYKTDTFSYKNVDVTYNKVEQVYYDQETMDKASAFSKWNLEGWTLNVPKVISGQSRSIQGFGEKAPDLNETKKVTHEIYPNGSIKTDMFIHYTTSLVPNKDTGRFVSVMDISLNKK